MTTGTKILSLHVTSAWVSRARNNMISNKSKRLYECHGLQTKD